MQVEADRLAQRVILKSIVEACLILEEGVSTTREIDFGMMAGAGFAVGPFAAADAWGLDTVIAELEQSAADVHPEFEPPTILRRLVGQGRLGVKSGQGFHSYPQPDEVVEGAVVRLETRADIAIAWLDRPPANSLSPKVIAELATLWNRVEADPSIRVLIIASANPQLFCAGADLKAFAAMDDPADVAAFVAQTHALMTALEGGSTITIAAVNAPAYGGGCELAMACDVRIAAQSAVFGQPEVDLGIMPGFGGTQRLGRLVGYAKALEMNLVGRPITAEDAYQFGLSNQTVPDHELMDTTLLWARRLARQAPLAVAGVKQAMGAAGGGLRSGLEAEADAFSATFATEDAREGIGAFLAKRRPVWRGR